jgi:riboflavin transporter FmnP
MKSTKKLTISALLLALALILPFFTGQIREIGNKLLPMHIPVLLCGFICGWQYGLVVGLIAPLLRFAFFSMPPMPNALTMAIELAGYGCVSGFLYRKLPKSKWRIPIALIVSMITGRILWGIASILVYGFSRQLFTWQLFIGGAFLNALPGIIIQLISIPILVLTLEKAGVVSHDTN